MDSSRFIAVATDDPRLEVDRDEHGGRPRSVPFMGHPAEMLLDQARSQLERQETKLDAMRTVAGTVLSAAGVIVAFVAPDVTKSHPWFALPALVAFAICVILGCYVLMPQPLSFNEFLDTYAEWVETEGDHEEADVSFALSLAKSLEASRMKNRGRVDLLARVVAAQVIALGVEAMAWSVALAFV